MTTGEGAALALAGPALDSDAGPLEQLWRAALAALDSDRGGTALVAELLSDRTIEEAFQVAVAGTEGQLFLGSYDGAPCGISYLRRTSPQSVTQLLLFVEEPFRLVGVGDALVDAAEAWSEACHCRLDVAVLPGDRATKSLFEGRGYLARLLTMRGRDRGDGGN